MDILSKETLEIIRKYVVSTGRKDSDFSEVVTLGGDEFFALYKGNRNLRVSSATLKHLFSNGDVQTLGGIQVLEKYSDLAGISAKTYGNLVYVKETDEYYSWSASNEWHSLPKIYIGSNEPEDKTVLWIDPEDDSTLDLAEDETIKNMQEAIKQLQANQKLLNRVVNLGVIAGDSNNSVRVDISNSANPIKPEDAPEDVEGGEKPDTSEVDHTVPAISVKMDTALNFAKNKANLTDGEMLFYTDKHKLVTYYNGRFYQAGTGGGAGGGSGAGISLEDLYNSDLEYLIFTNGNSTYKVQASKDGSLIIRKYSGEQTTISNAQLDASWGVYVNYLLHINTVFCGGNNTEGTACSHNFVELANGSNEDINLNGLMLLYTDGTESDGNGFIWKVLELQGTIKAHGTFLIRGARCNTDKASFIRVSECDQEWLDDNSPIKFNQGKASFYLAVGNPATHFVYDADGNDLATNALRSPWIKKSAYVGYIDSVGFGTDSVGEGATHITLQPTDDWSDVMFVRWYMFEPAKQGNKAYGKRKTTTEWTYINLTKEDEYRGNSIQYYYPDYMKQRFAPQVSWKHKDFFTNKNIFDDKKPNMLNITFGIQATTDEANGVKASRCFNWVSVGYYDEYLEYRKKGESTWTRVYSITPTDPNNTAAINQFIDHYKRLRWCTSNGTWVTTHKVVLSGVFDRDVYEYRVGRRGDSSYQSDIYEFTVRDNSEVTHFTYIQNTDQQGFNWAEYQAWKRALYCMSKNEGPDFTINTGDITQSGNRENEWLDYYDGRQYMRNVEEMFTIGNNDLCGHDATQLTDGNDATSKYNHINILRYYTFELDPRNNYSFLWGDNQYPLYSIYSFNYGSWHFVSLNSQIAVASSKTYKGYESDTYAGDATYANAANAAIEAWFTKDLQLWQNTDSEPSDCKKCIVYMHEMPFTMVTWSFMNGSSSRAGSHLNTLNNNGLYRFSRLFKKYGIRLVMGGHKHTYTFSKPIYDAPDGYINSSHKPDGSIDFMGEVTTAASRIPVIQVTSASDIDKTMDGVFARYEVVDKINAPFYVMSQATGYKLVSNKEQPSGPQYTIPWLLNYYKAKTNAASPTENKAQHLPMYVRYEVSDTEITITAIQVQGVYDVNIDKNTASYDMNNQLPTLTPSEVTLSQITDADAKAYGVTDKKSFTIKL